MLHGGLAQINKTLDAVTTTPQLSNEPDPFSPFSVLTLLFSSQKQPQDQEKLLRMTVKMIRKF